MRLSVPHRFPALIADPPRGQGRLWLTGARVFDGTGGPVRDGMAVPVEDGGIQRVATASEPCPDRGPPLDVQQPAAMTRPIPTPTPILSPTPPTLPMAQ